MINPTMKLSSMGIGFGFVDVLVRFCLCFLFHRIEKVVVEAGVGDGWVPFPLILNGGELTGDS